MTDGEICESYRTAKDKNKQIPIIAQLSAKPKEEVIAILEANGYIVDGRLKKRKLPAEMAKPKEPAGQSVCMDRTELEAAAWRTLRRIGSHENTVYEALCLFISEIVGDS